MFSLTVELYEELCHSKWSIERCLDILEDEFDAFNIDSIYELYIKLEHAGEVVGEFINSYDNDSILTILEWEDKANNMLNEFIIASPGTYLEIAEELYDDCAESVEEPGSYPTEPHFTETDDYDVNDFFNVKQHDFDKLCDIVCENLAKRYRRNTRVLNAIIKSC